MATKVELKSSIAAVIKNNPTTKIRGQVLQDKLFEIVDECYNEAGGGGGATVTDVTHAQLISKINANELVVGSWYRITDYRTVNYVHGSESASGYSLFDVHINTVEPLLVVAIKTNELSTIAYSETYPDDILYYHPTAYSLLPSLIDNVNTAVDNRGIVYRRIDTLTNNDMPFDFKGQKWRRYTNTGGQYLLLQDTDNTGVYRDEFMFDFSINENRDNKLNSSYYFIDMGVAFDPSLSGKVIGFNINENSIIGNNFNNNTIGNNFNNNTIGNNFYSNTVGNDFYGNTIGNYFYGNTIGNNFYNNTIGNYFYSNTVGNDFYSNTIGDNFRSNTIGNNFRSNTIGNNFNRNTIGNDFSSNTIGNNFNNNTIGNNFYSNTINSYYNNNTIDNNFQSNTIGNYFYGNTIGNYFYSNTIGNNFYSNTIGNNFQSNTIGDNFRSNTIGNDFSSNTVGNNFNRNTIKYPIGSTDFTSATHVYGDYNTEIIKNANGDFKLKYYNASDTLTSAAITD